MKKALAGILSTAMIFTSGVIPNTLTSVQAATTYNDTTTALSSLAGSTGLKMYELTSSDAGAQLSNGIYYMNSDLTLNEDKSHYNGLKIAENATAYIYIPKGRTLTESMREMVVMPQNQVLHSMIIHMTVLHLDVLMRCRCCINCKRCFCYSI